MIDEHCIFCKIIQGIIPSKKYFENDKFLAFFDINPIATNHVVFIAKNHYENLNEMPDGE
jgi:histidine triad (HIT) family protein